MKWIAFTWKVAINTTYVIVVIAVLSASEPSNRQIIAVLGLIYAAIRSIAIGQAIGLTNALFYLEKKIDRIRYQVDSSFSEPDYAEAEETISFNSAKLYIDATGLGIISLICLFVVLFGR